MDKCVQIKHREEIRMGLFDFLNLFKKKVPEKKPAKNSDGTYIRKIKIAGSTYDNKDGSSRQNFLKDIYNKKPPFDKQLDLMIEQFEYEGSPAYYFFVNGKCVGVVEQERANFIAKNKKNIGKLSQDEIKNSAYEIFESTLEGEDFYALKLPKNVFLLTLLKTETLRCCKFLNDEQSVCDFKPIYMEKYFGPNSDFKPIELDINGKKYTISGIVDRIDATENEYRIIDYKSGNTTNKNGAEKLFYGTKVQLFVYAYAIKNNMDKKFFGAF